MQGGGGAPQPIMAFGAAAAAAPSGAGCLASLTSDNVQRFPEMTNNQVLRGDHQVGGAGMAGLTLVTLLGQVPGRSPADGGYAPYFRFMPMLCLGYSNLMPMLCQCYVSVIATLCQCYVNLMPMLCHDYYRTTTTIIAETRQNVTLSAKADGAPPHV